MALYSVIATQDPKTIDLRDPSYNELTEDKPLIQSVHSAIR
jgi:hypothetical protein